MNTLQRIGSYVWPYRKRLFLSFLCAILVSVFWSLNLSITFPIVRVLFENDSIHSYVDEQIDTHHKSIDEHSAALAKLADNDIVQHARLQRKLNDASQSLLFHKAVKDSVLPYIPTDKFYTMLLIMGTVLVATLLKGVSIYLQELCVGSVVHSSANDIRAAAFRNAIDLDYQTQTSEGTSRLTARLTNDVTELANGLHTFASQLVREPLKAMGCITVAMYINWRLTLMAMLVVPLIGMVFYKAGRLLRSGAKRTLESMANIYRSITETFDSTRVVIAFSGQTHHNGQLTKANQEYYGQSMKLIRISALIRPTTELLGVIAISIVFVPGVYMVLHGTDGIAGVKLASGPLSIAELVTLYALLAGVLDPVRKLSSVFAQLKRSLVAADRVFELADKPTLVPEPLTPQPMIRHCQSIAFENVSFRYHGSDDEHSLRPNALSDISLTIPFGEVVAVVGGNGCGKSTLISLLPRLLDPSEGTVRIDGVDTTGVSLADLRSQIGIVTQDTMLFDESIYDNVVYGNPAATKAQVEDALKQAHAFDFIAMLPDGLNTQMGARGQRLSGGQKQRISLARAIIRDPAILILDEATSAVDAESEAVIYNVLKEFCKGRTVFLITHAINEAVIGLIDRVVILEQGQVVANGTHDELAQSCPEYSRLIQYDAQPRKVA